MRVFALVVLLLGFAKSGMTQDLILTIAGDSIICKINRTDDKFVYYRTAKTKRSEYELISKREVRTLLYDVYAGEGSDIAAIREPLGYKQFQVWGLGGFSRLLNAPSDLPEEFDDYNNELRSSFFYSAGFNVFLNEQLGLGGIFSTSSYSNSADVQTTSTPPVFGKLIDDISLRYIGLNMALRLETEIPSLSIQLDFGLGISSYTNDGTIIFDYRLQGNAIGGHLSAALRLKLGEGVYLPVHLRLLGFNISTFDFTPGADVPEADAQDLELIVLSNAPVSIARFQIGAGLVVSF